MNNKPHTVNGREGIDAQSTGEFADMNADQAVVKMNLDQGKRYEHRKIENLMGKETLRFSAGPEHSEHAEEQHGEKKHDDHEHAEHGNSGHAKGATTETDNAENPNTMDGVRKSLIFASAGAVGAYVIPTAFPVFWASLKANVLNFASTFGPAGNILVGPTMTGVSAAISGTALTLGAVAALGKVTNMMMRGNGEIFGTLGRKIGDYSRVLFGYDKDKVPPAVGVKGSLWEGARRVMGAWYLPIGAVKMLGHMTKDTWNSWPITTVRKNKYAALAGAALGFGLAPVALTGIVAGAAAGTALGAAYKAGDKGGDSHDHGHGGGHH